MRGAITLFPMAQGAQTEAKGGGQFCLSHAKFFSNFFYIKRRKLMYNGIGFLSLSKLDGFGQPLSNTVKCLTHGLSP